MSKLLKIAVFTACASLVPAAQATDYGPYATDYARVIHVEPIYREVAVSTPQRQCYDQPVYHHYRSNGGGNGMLGAVVGGVVGG
ncbi:MAG: hypothetical protein L0H63_15515, partial [Nitrococcus sp.]|nr:hypothetical protein [Nitrococcus sp.]